MKILVISVQNLEASILEPMLNDLEDIFAEEGYDA
jgi:hypothetical protein